MEFQFNSSSFEREVHSHTIRMVDLQQTITTNSLLQIKTREKLNRTIAIALCSKV